MKYGYARVSTEDQRLDMQLNALKEKGCVKIFKEKRGALKDRPRLDKLLNTVVKGDEIIIFKLDRLGRSLKHLIDIIETLKDKEVNLISIHDSFDTTSTQGKLMFQIIGAFAEFERNLISERTKSGLQAVRDKGGRLGRPLGLTQQARNDTELVKLWHKKKPVSEICRLLKICKSSYYKYLKYDLNE